jgi:excinuclease ABC subunit B
VRAVAEPTEGAFGLVSSFRPAGDQPQAIARLADGVRRGLRDQVLLGVTGSGKTFTIANLVAEVQRPTLVIAPNKTLAAQLCSEFKEFLPANSVEYFVSYYDYYQPEAYIAQTDTYIEKEALVNEEIDRLRHSATMSLFERRDTLIVASVSCIFGLGSPQDYSTRVLSARVGQRRDRDEALRRLVSIQYHRNDLTLVRGTFRVRGDVLEVFPAGARERALRIEWFGDTVERISEVDVVTGEVLRDLHHAAIYPNTHYVIAPERLAEALATIEAELEGRLAELRRMDKLLEAQRLEQRTRYDLEMLRESGTCFGVENYSRHLTGRQPGRPPYTLLDFFPRDWLLVVDESHVTIPQIHGMYGGDRSRKDALVEHGFRLPSAYDNRPLTFAEFEARINQAVYVSATPGSYEQSRAAQVVEQIVRPTGLIDPAVEVRGTKGQIDDLLGEINRRVGAGERVLVTTLTKKMAEDLADYLRDAGVAVRYLHSEIKTLERMEILRDLRLGVFDVLVGINLLREGLDLPEVSLVAILDADKEGYLRSATSLIQTIGRAARNLHGQVIMYADGVTASMRRAIDETERRRRRQMEFNAEHGITPATVQKAVRQVIETTRQVDGKALALLPGRLADLPRRDIPALIEKLKQEMQGAAKRLEFEYAADLRDMLFELEETARGGKPAAAAAGKPGAAAAGRPAIARQSAAGKGGGPGTPRGRRPIR